jgi:hypothetical protein
MCTYQKYTLLFWGALLIQQMKYESFCTMHLSCFVRRKQE